MVGVCYSVQSAYGIPGMLLNFERVSPDRKGRDLDVNSQDV